MFCQKTAVISVHAKIKLNFIDNAVAILSSEIIRYCVHLVWLTFSVVRVVTNLEQLLVLPAVTEIGIQFYLP